MRFFVTIFLLAVLAFLVSQIFALNSQRINYEEKVMQASAETVILTEENNWLERDLEYYKNGENLSKELRARFNYRAADEKLLILVPGQED